MPGFPDGEAMQSRAAPPHPFKTLTPSQLGGIFGLSSLRDRTGTTVGRGAACPQLERAQTS